MSKQAVGQLVNELESYGVVERVPDPSDGRARLIRFSEEGRKALLDGLKVLGVLEEEFTVIIGKRRMKALHDGLSALHADAAGASSSMDASNGLAGQIYRTGQCNPNNKIKPDITRTCKWVCRIRIRRSSPVFINPTWGLIEVLVAWRSAPPLSKVFE